MDEAESSLRLEASTSGLADRVPLLSARSLVSKGQRNVLLLFVVLLIVGLVVNLSLTVSMVIGIITLAYIGAVPIVCTCFMRSTRRDVVEVVSDEEALAVGEERLPFYTVLIPGLPGGLGHTNNLVEHICPVSTTP